MESDPNFSAAVLAHANSSALAGRKPVGSIRLALARIGSRSAASQLLGLAVTKVFIPRDPWEKSLWRHALQTASAARAIAVRFADAKINPDEAYTAGLLHDVGRFVMFLRAPEVLKRIDENDWEDSEQLLDLERSICGLCHGELGALICGHWNFPEALLSAIELHHIPPTSPPESETEKLVALVRLADCAMFRSAMPGSAGLHEVEDEELSCALDGIIPPFIHTTALALRPLIRAATEDAAAISAALGLV